MITEKDTIKCESVFNDDYTHRFLWKRIWDKDKPMVTVIALNPSQADNIVTDTTTSLIVNNVAKLEEFGRRFRPAGRRLLRPGPVDVQRHQRRRGAARGSARE